MAHLPGDLADCAWPLFLLLVLTLAGCGRPAAPPLEDGVIYKNQYEGFRFTTPEGWKQRARGEVPAGPVQGERMLVEYKCFTCAKPASLEVTVASIPQAASLSDYVTQHTKTGEQWRFEPPAQEFTINGAPAVRITYLLTAGKDEMTREIVAFRRGDRVYFFKGFYIQSDVRSRKEIRAAVDSVVW